MTEKVQLKNILVLEKTAGDFSQCSKIKNTGNVMKHGTTMPILRYNIIIERSLRFILVNLFKQNISWCTFTTIK